MKSYSSLKPQKAVEFATITGTVLQGKVVLSQDTTTIGSINAQHDKESDRVTLALSHLTAHTIPVFAFGKAIFEITKEILCGKESASQILWEVHACDATLCTALQNFGCKAETESGPHLFKCSYNKVPLEISHNSLNELSRALSIASKSLYAIQGAPNSTVLNFAIALHFENVRTQNQICNMALADILAHPRYSKVLSEARDEVHYCGRRFQRGSSAHNLILSSAIQRSIRHSELRQSAIMDTTDNFLYCDEHTNLLPEWVHINTLIQERAQIESLLWI